MYFAYGANMSRTSMSIRCPHAEPVRAFHLQGWRLVFDNHATIVPEPGSTVAGCLWNITDLCEAHLDEFEGYPDYYNKTWITQQGFTFMVYIMNPPLNFNNIPHQSYTDLLEEGYQDWNLSKTLNRV